MSMERTFFMIKPDGVQRGLIGEIIGRMERKGFKIIGSKMLRLDAPLASKHYAEHQGKPFFEDLVNFITSGPVVALVLEGEDAVAVVRGMMGETDPKASLPGTIRGDLGMAMSRNVVHGSDSAKSAAREISQFFPEDELTVYKKDIDDWVYPQIDQTEV